jgi:hypothetical protein
VGRTIEQDEEKNRMVKDCDYEKAEEKNRRY